MTGSWGLYLVKYNTNKCIQRKTFGVIRKNGDNSLREGILSAWFGRVRPKMYTHSRKGKTCIDIVILNLCRHHEINTSYLWTRQSQDMLKMVAFLDSVFAHSHSEKLERLAGSVAVPCLVERKINHFHVWHFDKTTKDKVFLSWRAYTSLVGLCIYILNLDYFLLLWTLKIRWIHVFDSLGLFCFFYFLKQKWIRTGFDR